MNPKCSRWETCYSFNELTSCRGCSFQHFENVLNAHKENKDLQFLGDRYFKLISEKRKGEGGRIALDEPMRELFINRIPELISIPQEKLKVKLFGEDFRIKADGAFQADETCIFFELKGVGDDTNSVLSAIVAAQLLKKVPEFNKSFYYYIGIQSGSKQYPNGLERMSFLDDKRLGIAPYVRWAESNNFLKFYGIVDIQSLLADIQKQIQ